MMGKRVIEIYSPGRFLIQILAILAMSGGILLPREIAGKSPEAIAISPGAYGLTHDGENFWYSVPRERRLYRISRQGESRSFFMGNIPIYGIRFHPGEGLIYVASARKILKIDPVTGGIQDSLSLPIAQITGIAFYGNLIYLLEKGTGVVHIFDAGLDRIIDSFDTSRRGLRDIVAYHNYIWLGDGDNGIIYRRNVSTRKQAGSLVGPLRKLRGFCFRGYQLWMIHRDRRAIVRLPLLESERYILSGERRFRVEVALNYRLTPPMEGELIVLQPPVMPAQRPHGVRAETSGWEGNRFTPSGERVFSRKINPGESGAQEFKYRFSLSLRNARYFIPLNYKPQKEELAAGQAFLFTDITEARFNSTAPLLTMQSLMKRAGDRPSDSGRWRKDLTHLLRKTPLPRRRLLFFQIDRQAGASAPRRGYEVYLRDFGWLPLFGPADDPPEYRSYSRDLYTMVLSRSPEFRCETGGPLYHVSGKKEGGMRNLKALPVKIKIRIKIADDS